jgi:serine/threonine protein kinase/tetratricopeptide (TPR) repeat protein
MSSTPPTAQFDTDPVKTLPQSPETPPPLPPSGSRYRVLRPHARGGLGEVFVAEDTELGRRVALKEIQARYADNEASRTRFVLEAEITGGLEHPGIVPVYGLGTYADGRPFYAMRFIHGESLREAIHRFHGLASVDPSGRRVASASDESTSASRFDARQYDSLAFRQLLTRFASVCQAVAYAHSRGVIHRDLKPANIMLGKFGETLVVDWGLAKPIGRLEEAADAEATLRPRSAADSSATVMGQALGTPAYMSPEQADGRLDRLGPSSDIYSLGATLYELLTGRPPFTGDVLDILSHIRRGEVPSPRNVRPDIPRPLAAVCLKAMSFKPSDRYPTADALATDVERWLADEPVSAYREPVRVRLGRWVKRHRPLVAGLTAVLLTGLVSLVVLLLHSENARTEIADQLRRAEEARTYTRRALDDMTSDLTEGALMTQRELSPAQAEFLKRVLVYYKNFAAEPGHDREGRERLANASGRVGVIQYRLGQLREADAALRKAEELFAGLAAEFPERSDYRLELASNHNNRGNVLADLGDTGGAETAYRAALRVKQQLLAERPDDPESRSGLAAAYRSLGVVLRQQGRRGDAASAFRSAMDLQERLVAQLPSVADNPAVAAYHWELARSRSDLGNLLFELAETDKAESALRTAVTRFEELATHFRDKPDYRDELATAYLNWGRALLILGRAEEAQSALDAARTRQARLVADYPGVPEYRRLLGQIQINLTTANVAAAKKKLTGGGWSLFGTRPPKRPLDLGEAQRLAESNESTGEELYHSAAAFAVAATQADAPTAEQHAVRAVTALRQAFARGFRDATRMLTDSDFASLRNRTDFIELLWDVADGR